MNNRDDNSNIYRISEYKRENQTKENIGNLNINGNIYNIAEYKREKKKKSINEILNILAFNNPFFGNENIQNSYIKNFSNLVEGKKNIDNTQALTITGKLFFDINNNNYNYFLNKIGKLFNENEYMEYKRVFLLRVDTVKYRNNQSIRNYLIDKNIYNNKDKIILLIDFIKNEYIKIIEEAEKLKKDKIREKIREIIKIVK